MSSLAAPVIEGCLNGLHGLIMAYGQTASGKSHTMGILQGVDLAVDEVSFAPTSGKDLLEATIRANRTSDKEGVWTGGAERPIGSVARYGSAPVVHSARHEADPGILPRALSRVFEHVALSRSAQRTEVLVKVSLLQIYNETVQVSANIFTVALQTVRMFLRLQRIHETALHQQAGFRAVSLETLHCYRKQMSSAVSCDVRHIDLAC